MTDLRTLFSQARTNVAEARKPAPREQDLARIESAAAALPSDGPLHQIVLALNEVLSALVDLDATQPGAWTGTRLDPLCADPEAALDELVCEPVAYALRVSLYRLGQHAHRLTGDIDIMRAIHLKAANMTGDARATEYRRDVLDKAWHGIGDERGCWVS